MADSDSATTEFALAPPAGLTWPLPGKPQFLRLECHAAGALQAAGDEPEFVVWANLDDAFCPGMMPAAAQSARTRMP
ncbi:MAG: hypothetical protein K2X49_29305 [Acetobacteraceae bacterium]|nr:hypothetical protein [Acetobacteraceae bacterium]